MTNTLLHLGSWYARLSHWWRSRVGTEIKPTGAQVCDPPPLAVNARIEAAEARLLECPQVDMPLTHRFAPGVYFREIFMPAGTLVIGHEHKTEHFNVILSGSALVSMDGQVQRIVAPTVLVSKPGVRKMLLIQEDMRWATIHPTSETNLDALETELIVKSASWLNHQHHLADAQRLHAALAATQKESSCHLQP